MASTSASNTFYNAKPCMEKPLIYLQPCRKALGPIREWDGSFRNPINPVSRTGDVHKEFHLSKMAGGISIMTMSNVATSLVDRSQTE